MTRASDPRQNPTREQWDAFFGYRENARPLSPRWGVTRGARAKVQARRDFCQVLFVLGEVMRRLAGCDTGSR